MAAEHEPALILAAPDAVRLALARGLLEEAGIPTEDRGQDYQHTADLMMPGAIMRPNLYVPLAAFEKARAILVEAMGEDLEGLAPPLPA